MQKQFKRTEVEIPQNYKTLKAPQAVIVLKAIDELQTFDLKQLDDKCAELGLVTTSKRGIRMVADWYRRIFKDDGLVIEIKQDKPANEKTKSNNKSRDTKQVKKTKKSKKLKTLKFENVCICDKYELQDGTIIEIFDMGEDDNEPYITIHSDNNKDLNECMSSGKFDSLGFKGYLIR